MVRKKGTPSRRATGKRRARQHHAECDVSWEREHRDRRGLASSLSVRRRSRAIRQGRPNRTASPFLDERANARSARRAGRLPLQKPKRGREEHELAVAYINLHGSLSFPGSVGSAEPRSDTSNYVGAREARGVGADSYHSPKGGLKDRPPAGSGGYHSRARGARPRASSRFRPPPRMSRDSR
jgi:hypothetical protein